MMPVFCFDNPVDILARLKPRAHNVHEGRIILLGTQIPFGQNSINHDIQGLLFEGGPSWINFYGNFVVGPNFLDL